MGISMRCPCLELHAATLPAIFAACLLLCGTIGCGSSNSPTVDTPPPPPATGVSFTGKAMAGSLPLIGASVQLYAAGTAGNGSSASALLSTALTTNSSGAFTIPATYTCPSTKSQLYVIARGGKPGPATSANSAIALLTTVGACNQITTSTQIVTNEVTTAAAAYALSQFLSSGGNVGASSTNAVGLQNAVATASALADITKGTSPGPAFAANGTSPAPIIDSLANLLNACAIAPAGNACNTLFSATTPSGAIAPANTLDAALNLVRNPSASVASLYTLSTASSAFGPALAAPPSDWTLYVNYTGGGIYTPGGIGVDSTGNVWVADYFGVASVFSSLGKPLLPQGITGFGLGVSYGLAIDVNDHAWVANAPNPGFVGNSISVLDSTGKSFSGSSGFTGAGLDYPTSIAFDTDGSAWVVDNGNNHLTHLSSSGLALSGASGFTSSQFAFPVAAAVDASHNVWLANESGTTVTKVSPDGSQFNSYQCGNAPSSLAIDQFGNVWVANYQGNSISEISSSGTILSPVPYTGGGINHPQGVAIDGAGNVWIGNFLGNSITKLAGAAAITPGAALSPAAGLGSGAALSDAFALAVDASGNLWVSNAGNNTLTEFIGLAPPVKTPLLALPAAP